MRHKEEANDYRYFPEPDLQPVIVTNLYIKKIKQLMPPLPNELFLKFTENFGLTDYDAGVLVEEKEIALYFNKVCCFVKNYKLAANFLNGVIKSYLNENGKKIQDLEISSERLAELINSVDDGLVSNTIATSKLFELLLISNKSIVDIISENNWKQESSKDALNDYIIKAVSKYPEKVIEYKSGKKGLIGLFMGEVMKISKGQADPKIANKLLRTELEK
jgi:aspartyl-tRNA(Asn)/glutamyl-tRNA(Gln) amidotransferase subunit B